MDIAFDIPLNPVSFGQVSWNLIYELYTRGENPHLFVKGNNADLSAFLRDDAFAGWLKERMLKTLESYRRDTPVVKLWHINGLLESFGRDNYGFTFHETDRLTDAERNILSNQRAIFVSSTYTRDVFEKHGLDNVVYCPLGFDHRHFKKTDRPYMGDDVISFGLRGKMEMRKNTMRVIRLWAQMFGNNPKYRLDCSIYNPFIKREDQENVIMQTLGATPPYNINFIGHQPLNSLYNDCLNAVDVDLTGMSSCEGFNLPCFQSLCIGKQAVVLNAHVHKDYANDKNAILVEPSGEMVDANDGIFFKKGEKFNVGRWPTYRDEDLAKALSLAAARAKQPNPEGEALKEKFTYEKTLETIFDTVLGAVAV